AIEPASLPEFTKIAKRERCPFHVVGTATLEQDIKVDSHFNQTLPVDLPTRILFADPPRMEKSLVRQESIFPAVNTQAIVLAESLQRVLMAPAVADKSFLITIGDRSVTGLVARDQMVGPWQV